MDAGGDTPDKPPQGWFADPFGVHEARWFSQGTPTALVRDGRKEAQDPPPEPSWTGRLLPAVVAAPPGPPDTDLDLAGQLGPRSEAGSQFGLLGDPALPGTVGDAVSTPAASRGLFGFRRGLPDLMERPPPTPKRLVSYRWIALGLAFGWTVLLSALVLSATTTTHPAGAPARTTTVYASDPAGVVLFIVALLACCAVTGVGLLRRVRAGSEAAGRIGYGVAGILVVLGLLSLGSIGLAFIVLAFALWVVARPLRRPRPMPGESVV